MSEKRKTKIKNGAMVKSYGREGRKKDEQTAGEEKTGKGRRMEVSVIERE